MAEDLPHVDMTPEQKLKFYVERLGNPNPELHKDAFLRLRQEVGTKFGSKNSVLKPSQSLRRCYDTLEKYYRTTLYPELKNLVADILSALAIRCGSRKHEILKYNLMGTKETSWWGHEYVCDLAEAIQENCHEWRGLPGMEEFISKLVDQMLPFLLRHRRHYGFVIELLGLIKQLDKLKDHCDKTTFKGVCHRLIQDGYLSIKLFTHLRSRAVGETYEEGMLKLNLALRIYLKCEDYPNALQLALFLHDLQRVRQVLTSCNDVLQKKQLCYILARHGITVELDKEMAANEEDRKMLQDIINNTKLSERYLNVAREMKVMELEPKYLEDIWKAHLLDGHTSAGASVVSARQNLAATFVNAFVNAGFGQDKLMTVLSDSSSSGSSGNWVSRNKEHGMTSAVASLGMIFLWDVDSGLPKFDKYFHSNDKHVIAGALLGVGIVNCNIKNEHDRAMALLGNYTDKEDALIRIGAIMGLGIAYAGSQNEQLRDKLVPILSDANASLDVIAFNAISLGLIYVGSCNEEVAQAIISALMDRSEPELEDPLTQLLPLGLGLLYLGKKKSVEATAKYLKRSEETFRKYCDLTLLSCAYAGTGDFHELVTLLEYIEKGEMNKAVAVLGIALASIDGEISFDEGIQQLDVLQYSHKQQNIRRAVPLALGVLCISNPKPFMELLEHHCPNVMDILSRLSRDTDSEVAMAAVISLGLIGAGTNNAEIAGKLCDLSSYYARDTDILFCVQIAQGLVHLGKGLLTLNPSHSDGLLISQTALAGLITVLHACCLDMKAMVLGKYHYVLYFLVLAMQPRMLLTVDENLKPLSVPVQVGRAVPSYDHTETGGRQRRITSKYACPIVSTPVLLNVGHMAELATEKYIPLTPMLEGVVILKENPD